MSAVDLTRYGIVPDEYSWPAGEIANAQPPGRVEFRIRNRQLFLVKLVTVTINGAGHSFALQIFETRPMAEADILTHPYPDTQRPKDAAPYVST